MSNKILLKDLQQSCVTTRGDASLPYLPVTSTLGALTAAVMDGGVGEADAIAGCTKADEVLQLKTEPKKPSATAVVAAKDQDDGRRTDCMSTQKIISLVVVVRYL